MIAPGGEDASAHELVRQVARAVDADYLLALGRQAPIRGLVPLPGQGPILTWRRVATEELEPPDDWALGLGDIELF